MRGFRAKDADRDRYIEVIEAAYVDGQISDADRDLRISRALTAGTLDELVELTRDLQNRPAPLDVATGRWRQDTEASAVRGPSGVVDLGALDVRRLFANIDRARRTLDVPGAELTHVLVNDWGGGPSVNVYVANDFSESGYLATTPSGDLVRAHPYRP